MEYKKLTDNELADFLQRACVQLTPELTQQLLSLGTELAEYRTKIEQGTLIELPCKVGDTVWEVSPFSNFTTAITAPNIHTILRWKEDEVFGRELFLTYAEAEKRLKELQE